MLLAIDIGNTDFTIGVFQGKKLCDTFRMRTKINRTSDEYGVFILNTLQYKGYDTKDVEDVIIASVVPAVMHSFAVPAKSMCALCPPLMQTSAR